MLIENGKSSLLRKGLSNIKISGQHMIFPRNGQRIIEVESSMLLSVFISCYLTFKAFLHTDLKSMILHKHDR
jgi:hypothetical protein